MSTITGSQAALAAGFPVTDDYNGDPPIIGRLTEMGVMKKRRRGGAVGVWERSSALYSARALSKRGSAACRRAT